MDMDLLWIVCSDADGTVAVAAGILDAGRLREGGKREGNRHLYREPGKGGKETENHLYRGAGNHLLYWRASNIREGRKGGENYCGRKGAANHREGYKGAGSTDHLYSGQEVTVGKPAPVLPSPASYGWNNNEPRGIEGTLPCKSQHAHGENPTRILVSKLSRTTCSAD
jgi:hypothetical protein